MLKANYLSHKIKKEYILKWKALQNVKFYNKEILQLLIFKKTIMVNKYIMFKIFMIQLIKDIML